MPTRRHTLHGQRVILVCGFLLCFASVSHGGWDGSAWPAYLHSRGGQVQASNIYAALRERAYAVEDYSGTVPSAPSWYRSQRANLVNYKANAKTMAAYYVNPAFVTNGSLEGYLNGATNIPSRLSVNYVNVDFGNTGFSNLYAVLKIPTNFFDYTPYRGLDGVGPFTNDTTVGHAYGWTNSDTLAGGSYFPGSRTNWYTTDYGWDTLRHVVTNLRYRCMSGGGVNRNDGDLGTGYDGDLATAKSQAETQLNGHTVDNSGTFTRYIFSIIGYGDGTFYDVSLGNFWFSGSLSFSSYKAIKTNTPPGVVSTWFLTGLPTPCRNSSNADVYPADYDDYGLGFDKVGAWYPAISNNSGVADNTDCYGWQLTSSNAAVNSSGKWAWSFAVGGTNIVPDWPATPEIGETKSKGFKIQGSACVFSDLGAGTNGFAYP